MMATGTVTVRVSRFPGYFISEAGRLFSNKTGTLVELVGGAIGNYWGFTLSLAGRKYCRSAHVLVATAFLGPKIDDSHQVRHLDGNPRNNHHSNLAWGTAKQNADDRARHGRTWRGPLPYPVNRERGEARHCAKLTVPAIHQIFAMRAAGRTQTSIAKHFGVDRRVVSNVLSRHRWAHVPISEVVMAAVKKVAFLRQHNVPFRAQVAAAEIEAFGKAETP